MARTRQSATLTIPAVNPEGLTQPEWFAAAYKPRTAAERSRMVDAWERGEDPSEWRLAMQKATS